MENEFNPNPKFFLKKTPDELNVGESLAAVALYPVALLGGFIVLGAGLVGWSKLAERFGKKNKKSDELPFIEPEVQ